MYSSPPVTIGIPTFNRPELLRRALQCVARQHYPSLRVIVADNCSPGTQVDGVVEEFRVAIPGLEYVKHKENIGALKNFFFVLGMATGKYFMWFADDDEISDNFVSSLVGLIEADDKAVSATGNWVLMGPNNVERRMKTSSFRADSVFQRLVAYVWHADDSFFYGLHRLETLRQAQYCNYWWPNQDVLYNWAYVFLLDMVSRGRILVHPDLSVRFVNHEYTAKNYGANESIVLRLPKVILRRLNVHYLYLNKIGHNLGRLFVVPFAFVSLVSLARELAGVFGKVFVRIGQRLFKSGPVLFRRL